MLKIEKRKKLTEQEKIEKEKIKQENIAKMLSIIKKMKEGETSVYYIGEVLPEELHECTYLFYETGLVTFLQRRYKDIEHYFEYIMVRVSENYKKRYICYNLYSLAKGDLK